MNCLICRQAELVAGFTSIPFERDEFKLTVNNVPALVCPKCAEAIVSEDVATRLLSLVEDAVREGILEGIRDYSK